MKKYLMIGAAALMIGASFTSCSKEKDLYDPAGQAERFLQSYADAFIKIFGQPAATQDWGFGSQAQARATRADGYGVGAYPDANMWTSKGFLAPDPLTKAQKLRAQYYFQMNNIVNPNRPDYGTKDFFMQQVYDGGTDPMAGKSPEKYLAANNQTLIESGEHMDHLTCGPDHTHTYNFNNGTCSTNTNVANRDQTDVNNTAQQHSDEIMLLLNTKTSCFGYANSDASCVRDDRWTLVSAKAIDTFCDTDPNFASWLAGKLKEGEVDKKCDDDFHRDFIGFDFDMLPDEHIISGSYEWDYNVQPNKCIKVNYYNYFNFYIGDATKVWNGTELVDVTTVGEVGELYGNRVLYPYMPGTTEKVKMVSANSNEYCGSSETWDDTKWKYTETVNGQNTEYKRIDYMITALNEGKLPTTSSDKTWVKIGNCADGYYSDWIVTFMPANSGSVPPPPEYLDDPDYRIIAEDLTIADKGNDFDFNDVVFDVYYNQKDDTKAKIKLQAAGGTLPLEIRVGGQSYEVHQLFHVDVKQMVNTGAGPSVADADKPFFEVTIDKTDAAGDDGIKIYVQKGSDEELTWVPMTAEKGHVAAKVKVGHTYNWCAERQTIETRYTNFPDYVQNPSNYWPTTNNKWWE